MTNYQKTLVDIPNEKGIHIKSAGAKKEKYVYQYLKHYRNEEGKVRHKAKAIGKLDSETGKMYPNDYYFERYHLQPDLCEIKVMNYGYTYLILEITRRSGLFQSLEAVFGAKRALELMIISSYIICEGNSMDGIEDWQERTYLPDGIHQLSSQSTSRTFSSICHEERMRFFTIWIRHAFKGQTVCYDVTSISS